RLALQRQLVDRGQRRVQAERVVELQRTTGAAEPGQGDGTAQRRVAGIADRRRDGKAVHAAAADHHDELAGLGGPLRGGERLAAEELDRDAEPQRAGERLAAGGSGGGGVGHRRWNSGDINRMASPSSRVSARWMAVATSGVSRAPSASWASCTGLRPSSDWAAS